MRASCMRIIWGLQQNQLFCAHLTSSGRRQWHPTPSTLAWKIPWTEEPGRLQSIGSLRVGHDWVTSLSLFTFIHWRRKWQPTPVFLPGESQGQGSLVGCPLWGRRVGHDWSDLAAAAADIFWIRISETLDSRVYILMSSQIILTHPAEEPQGHKVWQGI